MLNQPHYPIEILISTGQHKQTKLASGRVASKAVMRVMVCFWFIMIYWPGL
jgi:hypothetical protein